MRDERGGATVFGCLALLALLAVAIGVLQVGSTLIARHRAQSAADLGALAAAGSLQRGSDKACAAAETVVHRMRSEVRRCTVEGWDAIVTVGNRVELAGIGTRSVQAVARAGPVDDE